MPINQPITSRCLSQGPNVGLTPDMVRIIHFFYTIFLLYGVHSAPALSQMSENADPFDADDSSVQVSPDRVTLSSYGHLAVDVAVGGAAVLGTILTAEAFLRLLKTHKKRFGNQQNEEKLGQTQRNHLSDEALREDEALQLLLEIAEKHAHKISSEGFDGKFEAFRVPKEIHQSLESVFKTKEDGTSNVEAFRKLKENLSPLLDFE